VADPQVRVFYRVVKSNPPTAADFMSYQERGIRPMRPLTGREHGRWSGVSHYDSAQAAATAAREKPRLGQYVAAVRIPADAPVRIEQTGRVQAHYTIWAEPSLLLSWVVSVTAVGDVH
jgi:hypothetical protein